MLECLFRIGIIGLPGAQRGLNSNETIEVGMTWLLGNHLKC